jgi:hypothetical protein
MISSKATNLAQEVARDFVAVLLVASISLAAGLLMNRLSTRTLPLLYQTPENRLDAELTSLVVAPPFAIAPAATIGLAQFR